jgi:hypothetical protein
VLQVEQVPRVPGHLHPTSAEVRAGEVAHNLPAQSPLRLLLIVYWEERDRHVGGVDEASLTKCGEGKVRHLLDGVINLVPDNGSLPWRRGFDGYLHPDLTNIQVMDLKGTAAADCNWPIVAESNDSAQELSWKTPGGVGSWYVDNHPH